jgi:hypothetical protein
MKLKTTVCRDGYKALAPLHLGQIVLTFRGSSDAVK